MLTLKYKMTVIMTTKSDGKLTYEVTRIAANTAFLEKRSGSAVHPARHQVPVTFDPAKIFPHIKKIDLEEAQQA